MVENITLLIHSRKAAALLRATVLYSGLTKLNIDFLLLVTLYIILGNVRRCKLMKEMNVIKRCDDVMNSFVMLWLLKLVVLKQFLPVVFRGPSHCSGGSSLSVNAGLVVG